MVLDNAIKQTEACRKGGVVLLTGHSTVLRHKVRYEMRREQVGGVIGYSFEVTYRGECAVCMVACSCKKARDIFFALLRGRVTPCSLAYVIQEVTEPGDVMERIEANNKILC